VAWVVTFGKGSPNLFVFVNTTNVGRPLTVELHRGTAGTDGPVVTTFEQSADPDSGDSDNIDRKVIQDINNDPGEFYLEIVNGEFPDGAIRGQLLG